MMQKALQGGSRKFIKRGQYYQLTMKQRKIIIWKKY